MKLPEEIQVGGTSYAIEVAEDGVQINNQGEVPAYTQMRGKIFLNGKMKEEVQIGALLTQIIKAINYEVTLGLTDEQISMLGNNLLPILKENDMDLVIKEPVETDIASVSSPDQDDS